MKQTQTVAVVMCTYNGASRHLAEQLDSLFAQTQPPKEIIVQDDCSTDNTMEMLADYARRAPHGVSIRTRSSRASTATSSQPCAVPQPTSSPFATRTTSGCLRSSRSKAPLSVRT